MGNEERHWLRRPTWINANDAVEGLLHDILAHRFDDIKLKIIIKTVEGLREELSK